MRWKGSQGLSRHVEKVGLHPECDEESWRVKSWGECSEGMVRLEAEGLLQRRNDGCVV